MEKKRKWIIALLMLLMVGFSTAWLMGAFSGPDLSKARELQQAMLDNMGKDLTREERREQWDKLRELPRDQRRQVMGKVFMQQMQQRMDDYFAASAEERTAMLDQQIKQMEEWRKRAEEWRKNGEEGGWRGRGGDGQNSANADGKTDSTTDEDKAAADKAEADRQQAKDNWRNMDRTQRMKARLDSTSAKQRAQFGLYQAAMNQRRADLGLPPMQGPGGPGGGPGGPGGGGWRRGPR